LPQTYPLAGMGQDAGVLVADGSTMVGGQNASAQVSNPRVTRDKRRPDQASKWSE